MKIQFKKCTLNKTSMQYLETINGIVEEYSLQGYKLTLRQLYYQLVSRDIIPNEIQSYKKLSRVLTEGRMAGIVDWNAIEDRLRQLSGNYTVEDIPDALSDAYEHYKLPRQRGQKKHVEVWVEKDAISNVLKRVTGKYGINILVNRGYGSASSVFDSYERFSQQLRYYKKEQIIVIYLGDHDPSGLDMIRDINDRVREMLSINGLEDSFEIKQVALTRQQIKQYKPPPNPAKQTDSRFDKYVAKHGSKSWEVDALKPEILHNILVSAIESEIDMKTYKAVMKLEEKEKEGIRLFETHADELFEYAKTL